MIKFKGMNKMGVFSLFSRYFIQKIGKISKMKLLNVLL